MNNTTNAFITLGNRLRQNLNEDKGRLNGNETSYKRFISIIQKANNENQWFTKANIIRAFEGIISMMDKNELTGFIENYKANSGNAINPKRVGVIMAGNIPMVGFHDLLCILLSGNFVVAKLAKDDTVLMTYIIELLTDIEPQLEEKIKVVDRLADIDAVIATGSNNSARYFEYYFGKYPHIIRKNRNAIAVIDGTESIEELKLLGSDIFTYFGLGCRNVSKLYVPEGYNFNLFFESIQSLAPELLDHNKYLNNFDYHNALFLLEKIPFLTNNFLIIKEGATVATPVSVINYEYYKNSEDLESKLTVESDNIQCLVSRTKPEIELFRKRCFYFGAAQKPSVSDFADGVNTMEFLIGLNRIT